MSLVLTLREGHDFYVGDARMVVGKVRTPMDFDIKSARGVHPVTDQKWTQLLEGVRVQAGIPRDMLGHIVRVTIDAKGIRVLRGDLYHQNKEHRCKTCGGSGVLSQPLFQTKGTVMQEFPCQDCNND